MLAIERRSYFQRLNRNVARMIHMETPEKNIWGTERNVLKQMWTCSQVRTGRCWLQNTNPHGKHLYHLTLHHLFGFLYFLTPKSNPTALHHFCDGRFFSLLYNLETKHQFCLLWKKEDYVGKDSRNRARKKKSPKPSLASFYITVALPTLPRFASGDSTNHWWKIF